MVSSPFAASIMGQERGWVGGRRDILSNDTGFQPNVHADPPPPPATPPPPSTPSPAPSAQLEQSKQSPSTSSDPHSALKTVDGSRNDDNGQQSDASDGDDEANDEASTSGWATGIRFAMAGEYNKAAKDDVLGEIKSGGG